MKLQEKQALVDELASKLDAASAFYLTDFTGLNVKNMTALRAKLREAGVEYRVVKNTLAKRALGTLEVPDISEFFTGPTGIAIGLDDPVMPAKILEEFAGEHDDRPAVKAGVVERKAVTPEEVGRLAKLPPQEDLLAELAGAMQAPLAQFAFLAESMLREVAGLLEALRSEKE